MGRKQNVLAVISSKMSVKVKHVVITLFIVGPGYSCLRFTYGNKFFPFLKSYIDFIRYTN